MIFKNSQKKEIKISQLENSIQTILPHSSEKTLLFISCLAGLLARIAYIDFEIHKKELIKMKDIFKVWTHLTDDEIQGTIQITLENARELAGLENHLYSNHIKNFLNKNDRYLLLQALFKLALSDGLISRTEEEEIRQICKSLDLEAKYFTAARASVIC